jgi:hypothetical protein
MAKEKAKIELQTNDNQGNQIEVAKSVPVARAKQYMRKSKPSAFGRKPRRRGKGRGVIIAKKDSVPAGSAFGRGNGPQDGSGPCGGTDICPMG